METNGKAQVLRIYISNTDTFKHEPLYEMVVRAAKRYQLAGATVTKGLLGFGSSSVLRSSKFWELTEKLPVVIEIVDDSQKIEQFTSIILPWFEKLRYGCLITVEEVSVLLYKKGTKKN